MTLLIKNGTFINLGLLVAAVVFFLSPWATLYIERGAYTYTGADFSGFTSKPLPSPLGILCPIGFLLSMFSFFTSRRELYNVLGGGMIIFGVAFSLANYSSLSIDATLAKLHSNIFLELIIGLLLIVINLTLLCIKYNSH